MLIRKRTIGVCAVYPSDKMKITGCFCALTDEKLFYLVVNGVAVHRPISNRLWPFPPVPTSTSDWGVRGGREPSFAPKWSVTDSPKPCYTSSSVLFFHSGSLIWSLRDLNPRPFGLRTVPFTATPLGRSARCRNSSLAPARRTQK